MIFEDMTDISVHNILYTMSSISFNSQDIHLEKEILVPCLKIMVVLNWLIYRHFFSLMF